MNIAFKEWSIVVDALGQGDQVVILRKGRIHEGETGFKLEHNAFLLFPTRFHQQRTLVTSEAQHRFDQRTLLNETGERLRIACIAEVIAAAEVHDFAAVQRLHGLHIWSEELIAQRFAWNNQPMIHAFFLHVSKLSSPVELPMAPDYAGCKSWVELERDIDTSNTTSVLNPDALREKLRAFHEALGISSTSFAKFP